MKAIVKVICLFIVVVVKGNLIFVAGTTATDSSEKELSVRSIDSNAKSDDEQQPFRVNLSSITSSNTLPIESKTTASSDKQQSITEKTTTAAVVIETQTSKNIQAAGKLTTLSPKVRKEKSDPYECPNTSDFNFFPHYCSIHSNCLTVGKEYRCCRQFNSKRCVKGVPKPLKEQRHEPILGLIPRKCPKEPLAELFWELKTCSTDHDCWPRICCPDGINKYCRTSRPELDGLPAGKQISYPIDALSGYLQCTPAPPSDYDFHPKPCNNTLDCFPNVCCQEAGKKYCRPPKRSLLAFLTTFAQRFNTGIIRQWTNNLVINK